MFTGLVEAVGTVVAVRDGADLRRLVLDTGLPTERLSLGASVAVDGVCLTIVEHVGGQLAFDVGPESLARTTLGRIRVGSRVHLERALGLGDAVGGHLVSGHVDAVGEVIAVRPRGDSLEMDISAPAELAPYLVAKGSVTVDGVSLTVNAVGGGTAGAQAAAGLARVWFSVTLIPHTLAVTVLGTRSVGSSVNLEADLIAKHVARAVRAYLDAEPRP